MPSPFPGMDPYLEHPRLWPDVHNSLIALMRGKLGPMLRPRYYVRLEERVYVAELPDEEFVVPDAVVGSARPSRRRGRRTGAAAKDAVAVRVPLMGEVRETFLEVRAVGKEDEDVVTVVEILSPTNKTGEGRALYLAKRKKVLSTRTNLVEIDLLRGGAPMPILDAPDLGDYRVLVCRGRRRPRADLFAFGVRDAIPRFALPLREDDDEPEVDLAAILAELYETAAYDLVIDYAQEPVPPLSGRDRTWARRLVRRK